MILFILLFVSLNCFADATLHLSGTIPDKGYAIINGHIIPAIGYTITINGVITTTKVKLTPNTDYTILVEVL